MEQYIEKKNGIYIPDLAGYRFVTKVAGNGSKLRELPRTMNDSLGYVEVNDDTHRDIILIKGVKRVAALDSPHCTQVSE